MTTAPRQLVLLCDGTNNNLSGRQADTHVVLLAELLARYPDPDRLVYYDPGVGNPGQLPGTTVTDKARRALDRVNGLAFGRGLYDNVAEGYQFLMAHWRPGDRIFVFGFSRGAFTARSIAGMVNAFGIVDHHQETLVSSLVATYFSQPTPARQAIVDQAARLFGQGTAPAARPVVHFVGVWDTVASVGLPPFGLKISTRPTLDNKCFRHVRHALALDEQRAQFLPRPYAQDDGAYRMANGESGDILQRWFRGAHCDVGGGNPHVDSELSRAPFAWLVAEAIACGLSLPPHGARTAPLTEAELLARLPVLDPPNAPARAPACIVSQTARTPLWALTGLAVRDTLSTQVDGEGPVQVQTAAHPSVAHWTHPYPTHTAWGRRRGIGHWGARLAGLLAIVVLATLTGTLLSSPTGVWPDELAAAWLANADFQRWQLSLAPIEAWAADAEAFHRPGRALLADLLLIGAYAGLLAPLVCRAFAQHARLIAVGQTPPAWLNRLGWALPLAVGADLLENLLTALALLATSQAPWALVTWALHGLLIAASLAKWLGLAGVGVLVVGSWFRLGGHGQHVVPVSA